MQDDFSSGPIEPTESSRIQKQEQMEAKKASMSQEQSKTSMRQFANEAAFTPVIMSRRFETLSEKIYRKEVEKKGETEGEEKVAAVEEIDATSKQFQKRNPELKARTLQNLIAQIRPGDSPEDILSKVMKNFPDFSLADEAFEFLEKFYKGQDLDNIRQAKENLNATYGREVIAGRNIGAEARAFAQHGLGSPTGLRDLYREITGNPRDATTLFTELKDKFTYKNLKVAIDFLLHSLGADLKAKGPSIPPALLHTLMGEARNLLAILWVFKFFEGRMNMIADAFERAGMLLPSYLNFEMLAKMFVQFLKERYPSMDKVFQMSLKMGVSANILAQVILYTQMRDAVRGVAPKMFRTEQHRHDVLMSFIEAIEELDEQLEEEEGGEE